MSVPSGSDDPEHVSGGRPEPDAPVKPDSLGDIRHHSWRYLTRRALREFMRDECADLAAGLTYFGVLAVLPGMIALISLLGVFGQGPRSVTTVLSVAREVMPASAFAILGPALEEVIQSSRAGLAVVLGIAGAVWFVSGYLAAFGRAMNRIYAIHEGRPIWKLQPLMLVVTLLIGVLCLLAVFLLLISGPLARVTGGVLGLGSAAVLAWNILKWPVLVAIAVVVIALLYYLTPNVRQPKFRWLSPGAALAILLWLATSALFGLYVARFASYNAIYGSLAGVIIFLIWLWLTNAALLLGAELDAELERARELQSGMAAERRVQLPPRDTRGSVKEAAQREKDYRAARQIRDRHARDDPDD